MPKFSSNTLETDLIPELGADIWNSSSANSRIKGTKILQTISVEIYTQVCNQVKTKKPNQNELLLHGRF